eukprot:TRINITY_DN510_c0_g1_i2.p1 TRINITY_DN510_c0_g1~~TRINITY_DN510_c0_g1_i2.p1  ORF type:complete len:382 (-),score=85.26 TRINITY_DN510_c0_g1_i2:36-1181(-)
MKSVGCFIVLILLLNVHITLGQSSNNGVGQTGSLSLLQGNLDWMITARRSIVITMKIQGKAWLAFGFHQANSELDGMAGADYIVGEYDDNGFINVWDGFNNETSKHKAPKPDSDFGGYDNIISFSGSYIDGFSVFTVERDMITNDTVADHPITNDQLNFIYAFGDGDLTLKYHGPNRGLIGVNFFTGKEAAVVPFSSSMKLIHGALMILAYGMCLSFGAFIARYLKEYYWWFPLHITIQVLGAVLALSGFIVALCMVTTHFNNWHSWIGITTLAFTFVTPFLGWIADKQYDPNRDRPPFWPDQVHWWFGRFAILLSYVSIILGMLKFGAPAALPAVFAGLPALWLISFVVVEIYRVYIKKDKISGAPLALYSSKDHLLPKK